MKPLLLVAFLHVFCLHAFGQIAQAILEEATQGTTKIVIDGLVETQRTRLLELNDEKSVAKFLELFGVTDPDEGLGEIDEDTVFLSCFCVPDNFITFEKSDGTYVSLGTKHKIQEVEFLEGSATPKLPRLKLTNRTRNKLSHIIKRARKDLANKSAHTTRANAPSWEPARHFNTSFTTRPIGG